MSRSCASGHEVLGARSSTHSSGHQAGIAHARVMEREVSRCLFDAPPSSTLVQGEEVALLK